MIIREVRPDETYETTAFMKRFEKETDFVRVDVDYAARRYEEMIESGLATVLVAEKDGELLGALGFVKVNDFNNGELIAIETFWFTAPEHRGVGLRLFVAFERAAKAAGCVKAAMIHLTDSMPEGLERLYLGRGYRLVEKHYMRDLND